MNSKIHLPQLLAVSTGLAALFVLASTALAPFGQDAEAGWPWKASHKVPAATGAPCVDLESEATCEWAGTWYWLRSPEQERRVIISRYNRYCVRCHGVDGRGVWDMPDVPDFTNAHWQASRSDAHLTRLILEGRGAVMPAFRGTLSLEESWAMARYLRTFAVEAPASRPDLRTPKEPAAPSSGPSSGR